MLGKFKSHVQEFLTGRDGAEELTPDLLGCLHLTGDLDRPFMRHMAVRTARTYPGSVGKMHRSLEFLIHVVVHLMARDAELLRVRELQRRVECAPEKDAADKTA